MSSPPPPPPIGAAKLITASRRYRGLYLVSGGCIRKVSQQLNSLAQTQAIVAQVEREIEQKTARARNANQPQLLTPPRHPGASLSARTARHFVQSLFPAGL